MKLVIVEDSELILTQLVRIISTHPRFEIVGTAGDERQAIALIERKNPDVILLDLQLSPGSGLNVLGRIRSSGNIARVLVLTNNTSSGLREACRNLGISGFYDKTLETQTCLNHLMSWLPQPPSDHSIRMNALKDVHLLDTPAQEIYDDLRRLAQDIAQTPMAMISLLDEHRQWFLSQHGMAVNESSRSMAFCANAILKDQLMEVHDTQEDDRFREHPMVTGEPYLRFYAGVPLVLPSGESLGTLCVLDTVPRQLTKFQHRALTTVAQSVISELELRKRVITLEREVARRQQAELQIHHLATRDALTGLPNRTTFLDRLQHQTKAASRLGTPIAVMFLDMDRFKLINDTLGHGAGDEALIIGTSRLLAAVREADTVARLGGDEFALILPHVTSAAQARQLGEKLCSALDEPLEIAGHRMRLGASVGIAMFPEHGDTADSLLQHADMAMYEAKKAGGGQTCLYRTEMDLEAHVALMHIGELRDAIERDEFEIHFQPQITLIDRRLCGMEVLVRWNHPTRGLVGPAQFIPLAEERGLIHAITKQVLSKSLAQLAKWDADGLSVPHVTVNVSAKELYPDLVDEVAALLARYGLEPQRLEIEITESALITDGVEALQMLSALRATGISVAVDDFGVGYSSLGQLHRLPIDCLKIDKCFVDNICINNSDMSIVKAIITLAEALGLHTIAEGAETQLQVARLQELGCDCVQGFFFAKPMLATAIPLWMDGLVNMAVPG